MQSDCLKGWVVCGTDYGDMHLKDFLGSIEESRVLYLGPGFLSNATWLLMLKKHYNGFNKKICRVNALQKYHLYF